MSLRNFLAPIDRLLKECWVPYAVIGGYAVAAWGEVRATRDIELLCRPTDLEAVQAALRGAHLDFEHRVGDLSDPIAHVIRVRVEPAGEPYEVDLIAGIEGAPPGIFERLRMVRVDDLEIPVASPEDVIILKLLGGSARDLEDARSVLRVQGEKLDLALLRRLCPIPLKESLEDLLKTP